MTQGKKQIANAIIWAAMIIATSIMTADTVDKDTNFMIMIIHVAGWISTSGLLRDKRTNIE